ncbi:hypothetical protein KIPB_000771 [Kipferlia bialata]|uniref:Uncharacterized protein n=1 Tax=Kipferlia bialata TaxID=797122 RepID=A0A9K3CNZ3_9EUKA|nr:hypothetical protein KIPB_000771 [Kipferlia bialata]|eukprot:g771.t1
MLHLTPVAIRKVTNGYGSRRRTEYTPVALADNVILDPASDQVYSVSSNEVGDLVCAGVDDYPSDLAPEWRNGREVHPVCVGSSVYFFTGFRGSQAQVYIGSLDGPRGEVTHRHVVITEGEGPNWSFNRVRVWAALGDKILLVLEEKNASTWLFDTDTESWQEELGPDLHYSGYCSEPDRAFVIGESLYLVSRGYCRHKRDTQGNTMRVWQCLTYSLRAGWSRLPDMALPDEDIRRINIVPATRSVSLVFEGERGGYHRSGGKAGLGGGIWLWDMLSGECSTRLRTDFETRTCLRLRDGCYLLETYTTGGDGWDWYQLDIDTSCLPEDGVPTRDSLCIKLSGTGLPLLQRLCIK